MRAPGGRAVGWSPGHRLPLVVAVVLVVAAAFLVVAARSGGDGHDGDSTAAAAAAWRQQSRPTGLVRATTASSASPSTVPSSTMPSSTVPPSTTTTVPPGPDEVTLVFAGDLLPHGAVNDRAAALGVASGRPYDYAPMFAPMAPVVSGADVAICHMEVPSAPDGERVTSYPSFGAPPELVDGAAAAGYDGCSTASNHSLDRGQAGLRRLLDQFDADGLQHAGTARSAEEAATTTVYEVEGVRIAHLSYAYDFNGYRIPADAPWSVNQIDPTRIAGDAARARSEGADLVVVSLHFGTEYDHEPSPYQRDVVAALLPSDDISAIVGHHAHVVQPIERVDDTYVVWGLGNQLSNQTQLPRRDGLTVRLRARPAGDGRWSIAAIDAIPTYVDLPSFDIYPVVDALADPATPERLRPELAASYDRTAAVLARATTEGVTLAPRP